MRSAYLMLLSLFCAAPGQFWVNPVDNMAYKFSQGMECLDVHEDAAALILYECEPYFKANQEFIWRKDPGMTSHLIFTTALHGSCLTIDGDSGQAPQQSAPAKLRPCDPNNTNALWDYSFEKKQMTLTHFPDLCLDYHSEWKSHFAIYPCQHHASGSIWPGTQDNQVITVDASIFDTTPRGPLVNAPQDNGTYLLSFGDYCLDFHIDGDQIVLYACNLQLNQEFQFRSAGDGVFQIYTASQGGKCLSVDGAAGQRPAEGTKITFRPCSETDVSQTWGYDSERRMLHSGAWSDLCADFMDAGVMSSDHYIVYTCKGADEDSANQNINIEIMPAQYAAFIVDRVVQNFDLPSQVPTSSRSGLGGFAMGAAAVLALIAALAGLGLVARRGRPGMRVRESVENSFITSNALD